MSRSNHEERYAFDPPKNMKEAKTRKRALERDIANISKQLSDPTRKDKRGKKLSTKDYLRWRGQARASLVFKQVEQVFLKDWIKERRRVIAAGELGVFDPNDPNHLLQVTREKLLEAKGQAPGLGELFDLIDQYLQHAA